MESVNDNRERKLRAIKEKAQERERRREEVRRRKQLRKEMAMQEGLEQGTNEIVGDASELIERQETPIVPEWKYSKIRYTAGTQGWSNIESKLIQRLYVESTLIQCWFNVVCPVGVTCDTHRHFVFGKQCKGISDQIWNALESEYKNSNIDNMIVFILSA